MNLDNNWISFASEIWPTLSLLDIRSYFEDGGKMRAVLEKWGLEEYATTIQLLQTLNKINRKDVILSLQEKYPSIGQYLEDQ